MALPALALLLLLLFHSTVWIGWRSARRVDAGPQRRSHVPRRDVMACASSRFHPSERNQRRIFPRSRLVCYRGLPL